MSTKFTYTTGGFAYASAVLWVAAAGVYALGNRISDDWDLAVYLFWAALVTLAGACLLVTAAGIRRMNHHREGWALGGIIVVGFGVAISVVMTWAIPLWMAVEGVGLIVLVLSCRPITVASVALSIGMPLGVAVFLVLSALKVGTVDQYGDYPIAWQAGLAVGALVVAAGLIGIGRQLRSIEVAPTVEEPATA